MNPDQQILNASALLVKFALARFQKATSFFPANPTPTTEKNPDDLNTPAHRNIQGAKQKTADQQSITYYGPIEGSDCHPQLGSDKVCSCIQEAVSMELLLSPGKAHFDFFLLGELTTKKNTQPGNPRSSVTGARVASGSRFGYRLPEIPKLCWGKSLGT